MARTRVGPKSRKATKKGWPSKTRSYSWRKSTPRPAMALKGIQAGVPKAASVHRFTRWTPQIDLVNYDVGAGVSGIKVTTDDTTPTMPLTVGNVTTDPGGSSVGSQTQLQYGGSIQFQLGDVPANSDFTSLFDHYAIEQVDIEVNCLQNDFSGGALAVSSPTITYVPDFDDATVPTSASYLSEFQRARTWTFSNANKSLKFSIKPRVAVPVYAGLGTAYVAGPQSAPLNASAYAVPHYGCKFWVRNATSGAGGSIQVGQHHLTFKMKYHLKFMDPK